MEAAGGGVLRDSNGNWLAGYQQNIGRCPIFQAELWAVLDGLSIAWEHRNRSIIVEVENWRLLQNHWCVKITHTNREATLADAVAHSGEEYVLWPYFSSTTPVRNSWNPSC
ncbi:hypothetical protein F3Y22_tig00110264pilonHSYRG00315 [Hibiscus syriacus]|uniref:RNase H type-1 domain-containing protein n=1 Tax=Hibiscus syriacus TaxID=106335 RepID=A0A6A3B4V2_HIBSY|nr:hypothetical protein F3Y22_tig00110264pilonHSYRG00315 [Hibiscus syriacus]